MEPGGSMPHSQGLSNNPNPESTQLLVLIPIYLRSILILSSHLRLDFSKGLFPVKIFKTLLPSSILATLPAHLYKKNNNNSVLQFDSDTSILFFLVHILHFWNILGATALGSKQVSHYNENLSYFLFFSSVFLFLASILSTVAMGRYAII